MAAPEFLPYTVLLSLHRYIKLPFEYLARHWRGHHSVARAFWINFILPVTTLLSVQSLIITPLIQDGRLNAVNTTIVLASVYVLMLIWQCVGLLRTVQGEIQSGSRTADIWAIHAAIFGLTLMIAIRLIDTLSSGVAAEMSLAKSRGKAFDDSVIGLDISVSEDKLVATVTGTLRVGATRLIRESLEQHPQVSTLIIDSDGGSVFEGRGIGILVRDNALSTHVRHQCLSACTLAFLGGTNRTASGTAVFGFHAYRVDAIYDAAWLNVAAQQKKDLDWFDQQGIPLWFRDKVYQTSATEMWLPERKVLLKAGFLTE